MISGQTLRVCPEGKPVPTHRVAARGHAFPIMPQASQILRNQLEVPQRRLAFRAGALERSLEAVTDVVVDQCFFGALDCTLHGLQLLRDLGAWPALLDHPDDGFEVAIGAFQASGNRGMWVVRHCSLLSSGEDSSDPPRGIGKSA